MRRPDVTIALLTWNRKRYLEKGLPALFANLSSNLTHEILIMDNASTDGTLEEIRKYETNPEVRIIANAKNVRYRGYNKLFGMARGEVIIEIDDDVIDFPKDFDLTLRSYLDVYRDYGYLALDTVRNELTDGNRGAWSGVDERGDMVVEEGESRGYCSAFRRRDYRKIRPLTFFFPFSLRHPQDYVISGLLRRVLGLRMGVVRGVRCLHAFGPLYAKKFGRVDLDRQKLFEPNSTKLVDDYDRALKNSGV